MTVREIYRRPTVIAGVALALVMAATGIFAPLLAPHDPVVGNLATMLCPPLSCAQLGQSHILGTDDIGRDVLSRIVASFSNYLHIGLVGTFVGLFAAWLLAIASSAREASLATGAARPLFGVPFWGLPVVAYPIGYFLYPILVLTVGSSHLLDIIYTGLFSALLPIALVYAVGAGPVGLAVRRGIAMSPAVFSLALLMGILFETAQAILAVGLLRPHPFLGTMVSDGRALSAWWMMVFPLAVVAASAGTFLAIVIATSRVISVAVGAARSDAPQALGIAPAGLRIRLAARVIDLTLIFLVVAVLTVLYDVTGLSSQDSSDLAAVFIGLIWFTVIYGIYAVSPGQRALGLRVLRLDGSPAGWGRKLCRSLATSLTFWINWLMITLRRDKRGLHDLACGTIAVRRWDLEHPSIPDNGAES